jgi:hypothetical protein
VIRSIALVAVGALVLSACSKGAEKIDQNDPAAGLSEHILTWRTDIEANHPACETKIEGKGCEGFTVSCKAMQTITPDEAAKGVNSKVIAAMTFTGRMEDGSTGKNGSAFASFARTGSAWTRTEAQPVNLSTCASL